MSSRSSDGSGRLVFTVDVEDWPQSTWDRSLPISVRARKNTERLLEMLEATNVRGTFFVLGLFAQAFPETVRQILAAGHEVASHGFGHVEIFRQTPGEFREDVRRSKALLEDVTGVAVLGYRAPDFSLVKATLWALDVLAEEGFRYDSSVFPLDRGRYGIGDWPRHATVMRSQRDSAIIEFPIGTAAMLGRRIPAGGGGYFRLFPGSLGRFFVHRSLRDGDFVFYCHPYEIDSREMSELRPRPPLLLRMHQGVGRRWFRRRLERLLARFSGCRFADLLEQRPEFAITAPPAPGI